MNLFSGAVFAGQEEYRQCGTSEPCEIGEYLFDDSYTPIATASCALTTRNPSGGLYLDEVAMTAAADGWYSYDVTTAGQDYGLYRSQVCCTHETEYLCLDKSFEIATPSSGLTGSQVADAVWDADPAAHDTTDTFGENLQTSSSLSAADFWAYPQRSLTTFGTLTADIWSYSSRSISSFASLVSSIWSNDDRTVTAASLDSGELATKNQVETVSTKLDEIEGFSDQFTELSEEVKTNRYFLEQLVNAPIIETFIEEGAASPDDLQAKIQETKEIARFLSTDTTNLKDQIIALNTNWEGASYQVALSGMTTASRVLGASTQDPSSPKTIGTRIAWLDQKWGSPIVGNLSTQAASALANVSNISREIKSYGKTFISKQYLDIAGEHVDKLQQIIGQEGDSIDTETLFGYIANLERIGDILVQQSLDLDRMIENWHEYTDGEKDIKIARVKRNVLEVNKIIEAESLLKTRVGDDKYRENSVLALQGLIDSNLILLAQNSEQVLQNIWLEHGSVIFRSLVINPSDIVAQKVKIKYYLPQEISSEHIVKIEDSLTTTFDAEKNALYVFGEVLLQPGETRTFIVEVVDVWVIAEEELASMRKQTEILFQSLEGTSYFAQGSTIKADIETGLDKIVLLQKNDQTPELKIKSHREAMLELNSVRAKIDSLKTIVSSAGSAGTMFGFVGGVQAIAVWGLIIILVAGFVFLFIYLKMIAGKSLSKSPEVVDATRKNDQESNPVQPVVEKSVAENITAQELVANNQDSSTLSLFKEIISMKLKSRHSNPKKGISWVAALVVGLFSMIGILLFLLIQQRQPSSDFISPLPTSNYQAQPLHVSQPDESGVVVSANQDGRDSEGVVLGSETQDQAPGQTSEEIMAELANEENQPTSEGLLVRINTPEGYKAVNVRAEPSIDAETIARLWVSQDVFVLQQQDDWVLIRTNNVDKIKSIQGWIQEVLISELE